MSFRVKSVKEVIRSKDHGWAPLFNLVYLIFFFIQPVYDHASPKQWFFDILGIIVFLLLYLGIFFLERPRALLHVSGMILLGVVFLPFNGAACTFFIYAAATAPFVVQTQGAGVRWLVTICAVAGIEGWLLKVNINALFFAAIFPLFVGGGNLFFAERNRMDRKLRKANEEIEHLAKVAERERIARDLHDVLGHTLSVITLKSELAGKLMDRDPERAGREIREVENISRQALADVRDTIRGYRTNGLVAELAQAKQTLETAGLTVQCEAATTVKLPALQESVLTLAVREAVTNVVRHARARSCRMRLEQQNGACRLEIQDDGVGCDSAEGNGLRGMRERVEMMGGSMQRTSESGTTLTITLPITQVLPKGEDGKN